jgi:hypothetical protein
LAEREMKKKLSRDAALHSDLAAAENQLEVEQIRNGFVFVRRGGNELQSEWFHRSEAMHQISSRGVSFLYIEIRDDFENICCGFQFLSQTKWSLDRELPSGSCHCASYPSHGGVVSP